MFSDMLLSPECAILVANRASRIPAQRAGSNGNLLSVVVIDELLHGISINKVVYNSYPPMLDKSTVVEVTATVKEFQRTNPYVWIEVIVGPKIFVVRVKTLL